MSRVTRVATIRRHLAQGGFVDLGLREATQKAGPDGHDVDGFAVRQHSQDGDLVVIAGAFGPNWLRTLAEVTGRLESPYVKCTVIGEVPGLGDHEVIVRWATPAELQARKTAQMQRQASLREQIRRQGAQQVAEEERQALEAAGQSSLF